MKPTILIDDSFMYTDRFWREHDDTHKFNRAQWPTIDEAKAIIGQLTRDVPHSYASAPDSTLLGRCREEGWGCEKNPQAAFEWYRRSAEAGYHRAQWNHAAALADRGLRTEAAEWFRRAAEGAKTATIP